MDYRKCAGLDKEEPPISLGKNLDIEERTLSYFPRVLIKLNPEEELKRIQTQTYGKEKGQPTKLYNHQNYGIHYPLVPGYRTTSSDYGFFPPDRATIATRYYPKENPFTKYFAIGGKRQTPSRLN